MKAKSSNSARVDPVAIFKLANTEWEGGRNKKAFGLFLEAALLGEASAQHNVGFFYDVGLGTKKNSKKALFWYKKAWRADRQTGTCINIAKLYASKKKLSSALFWWRKAISLGDGDAALDLAKFYLSKKQERHKTRAISLLRKVGASPHVTDDALAEAAKLLKNRSSSVALPD